MRLEQRGIKFVLTGTDLPDLTVDFGEDYPFTGPTYTCILRILSLGNRRFSIKLKIGGRWALYATTDADQQWSCELDLAQSVEGLHSYLQSQGFEFIRNMRCP